MSKFSGKCDVYDSVVMIPNSKNIDEYISKQKFLIFHYGKTLPLNISSYNELAPYFTHLMCISSSCDGQGTYIMTSRSFIDTEEEECLQLYLEYGFKLWRQCKRKKMPFDVDKYRAYLGERNYANELINRVQNDGLKANVKGLYMASKDEIYRIPFAKELEKCGYTDHFITQWVFSGRQVDWRKDNE